MGTRRVKRTTYKNVMARRKPPKNLEYFPGCIYPLAVCDALDDECPFRKAVDQVHNRPAVPPFSKNIDQDFTCRLAQKQIQEGWIGVPDRVKKQKPIRRYRKRKKDD